jgi:hypothetical protein
MDDGQTRAQDLVLEVEHPRIGTLRVPGGPYHFDCEPVRARLAPPLLVSRRPKSSPRPVTVRRRSTRLISSGAAQSSDS